MNKVRFSAQIFAMGVIFSIAFFLLLANSFKSYSSSMTILVSTKSELAAKQQEKILKNIVEFPKLLSFYDRMLNFNPDVRDVAKDLEPNERKKIWNEMISVEPIENSSIIKMSITAQRKNDAEQLAQKTARNLFDVVGTYYNIKDDLDLRIIDGPISEQNFSRWYFFLPLSIILGFVLAYFLQNVLEKSKAIFETREKENFAELKKLFSFGKENQKKPESQISSLEDLYKAEQAEAPYFRKQKAEEIPATETKEPESTPQREEMKRVTKMIQQNKYPNFPEMPFSRSKEKASAPDNLPVGDDSVLFGFNNNIKKEEEVEKKDILIEEENQSKQHEPTEDELRERLNKLLKGEIK